MFDPFDASQSRDSWPVLAELRATAPVVDVAGGLRYVTRHEPCREVLRDTAAFSNANGMKAPGIDVPMEDRLLGELDPPRHAAGAAHHGHGPHTEGGAHRPSRSSVRRAAALLDALPPRGVDLVAGFTVPLPNRVTTYLLGFEPGDANQLAALGQGIDGELIPATNQTEPRCRLRRRRSPEFAGYIDARLTTAPPSSPPARRPMTCSPSCSHSRSTASHSPAASCARWCGTSSPVG